MGCLLWVLKPELEGTALVGAVGRGAHAWPQDGSAASGAGRRAGSSRSPQVSGLEAPKSFHCVFLAVTPPRRKEAVKFLDLHFGKITLMLLQS